MNVRAPFFRNALNAVQTALMALALGVMSPPASAAEPKSYVQNYISAARIVEDKTAWLVEIRMMASDAEEIFQNTRAERRGVDLSAPGILEVEIGKMVAKRVAMRSKSGETCDRKVERSGEDPSSDEGVLVMLRFECKGGTVLYDPRELLAAHSPRAWQVVTVKNGENYRQKMMNAEAEPFVVREAN